MARKAHRTDNSVYSNIKMLSEFGFDYAVDSGVRYESKAYRLIRDKSNPHDANAIALYIYQIKVGYVERSIAKNIAPQMDSGDAFSARHFNSSNARDYNEKFDNKYGDGYYRQLSVQIYNESAIARAKGQELSPEVYSSLHTIIQNPKLSSKYNPGKQDISSNTGGCGCLVALLILASSAVMTAIAIVFT